MLVAIRSALLAPIILVLAEQAQAQDVILRIAPYSRQANESALATTLPLKFLVETPSDLRSGTVSTARIGERKTIGNISMGKVDTNPAPALLIRDVLKGELQAAGQTIAEQSPDIRLSSEVRRFDLWTDATLLYWDINVALDVAIEFADTTQRTQSSDYTASCSERTFIWPSSRLMTEVVTDCLRKIGDRFGNDANLRQFILSMPKS